MPPPDVIQSARALVGVCLPDGSTEGVENLVAPAAVQQSAPITNSEQLVEYRDDVQGVSYARPLEVSRQPTNIFQSNPLRARDQKTMIALGDALQFWINQQEAQGESVDPRLAEIAQILHSGRIPDASDVDFQTLVNQSFGDTALDAIIHSVALECDTSPNRQLHAQALSYSLSYFLQHDSSNPADTAIRSSLITALAHSQNTSSRAILLEASRLASPSIQAQVHQAFSQSYGSRPIISSGGESFSFTHHYLASPAVSASQTGQRLGFAATVGQAVYASAAQLGQWVQAHSDQIILGSVALLASPALTMNYAGARLISNGTQTLFPVSGNSTAFAGTPADSVIKSFYANYSLASTESLAPSFLFQPSLHYFPSGIVYSEQSAMCLIRAESSPYQSTRFMFQNAGLNGQESRSLVDALNSPLLVGYASLQGGVHQALSAQYALSVPFYSANQSPNAAYRVAPISYASGQEFDHDGFNGSSHEGSSQGESGEGSPQQGDQQQEGQDSQVPLADIYLNHRH